MENPLGAAGEETVAMEGLSSMIKLQQMIGKILQLCQGRSTLFFVLFFLAGNALAWTGKLTIVYVSYMAALLSAIVGHSYKCDLHDQALAKLGGIETDQKGDSK